MTLELKHSHEQFNAILASAADAIILADSMSTIISWNKGAEKIFTYSAEEAVGQPLEIIIPQSFRNSHNHGMQRFLTSKRSKVIGKTVELKGLKKDGSEIPIELSLSSWTINDDVYFSGIIRDISSRKRSEERIHYLAYHDDITGLPNRRQFEQRLTETLENLSDEDQHVAVMMLDLDGFKKVNDTLGHSAGDRLLQEVALRFRNCINEKYLIARMGGDEFTVMMPAIESTTEVQRIAEQLLYVLLEPISLMETAVPISTSIGIAISTGLNNDVESLLKEADIALYQAKNAGKATYEFFSDRSVQTLESIKDTI